MLEIHPAANLLPEMSAGEYCALVRSIEENGLREPVALLDGRILDGRHRHRACSELGVHAETVNLDIPESDAIAYVLDKNLHRRHLDESQRAMVGARIATLHRGANQHTAIAAPSQSDTAGKLNVSADSIQRAKSVQERGIPQLSSVVDSGQVTVSVAAGVSRMPVEMQEQFVAEVQSPANTKPPHQIVAAMGRDRKRDSIVQQSQVSELQTVKRYPVIYADPPWMYEIQSMGHTDRSIENHYPTMTLAEICRLPVAELATPDAVLFLWVTVPQIEAGISVLRAWGFEYKSHFVWVKDKIGTGYHTRNQHELLFIGRRGEIPLQERENTFSSVVTAPRAEHSAKPAVFAEMIATMYPEYSRIELFSRTSRPGWDAWGHEASSA